MFDVNSSFVKASRLMTVMTNSLGETSCLRLNSKCFRSVNFIPLGSS